MPDDEIYPTDDPVSIAKYGVRPFTATWILSNPPVVDDLLDARAYASAQALPMRTTLDHDGFFPALAIVDHLDPVTVLHRTSDTGLIVTGTGTVRNIVEERTVRGDGLLSWQSTIQIDLDATETADALLPVESLAFAGSETSLFGGPSSASFTWTNPTQPSVTPTEFQYRVIGKSLIWSIGSYAGVGADGVTVNWLEPATSYTFQVRLVRRVNGVITNASPIRQVAFTTAARILPTPVPDDEDTDVIVGEPPDFDPDDCEMEVELQENDGTGWVTVDTFTDAELTDNGDGTWSLTTPIPNSFFDDDKVYRFRSREVCGGINGDWFNGPSFDPPEDWDEPCTTPPALSVAPFNDPSLLVYVPKICAPDTITEAVSGIAGVHGEAYEAILAGVGDPEERALLAVAQPYWDDTPGGIVAYGECPQINSQTGDKTIACRVNVVEAESCVLFECAALHLTCAPGGAGWNAGATVFTPGGVMSLTSAELDLEVTYEIRAAYDSATGDFTLYVDDVEEDSDTFGEAQLTNNALPIWRVGAPPESWITDCALWGTLEVPEPTATLPDAILALNPVGYWKLDETSGTTANDSSGNARHGTYATPGTNITLAAVAGPDSVGYARFGQGSGSKVSIADNSDFSIIGGTSGLTVFALIHPDAGSGSATRSIVAKGNSPEEYEWLFMHFNTALAATVWGDTGTNLQAESVGVADMRADWHAVAFSTPNANYNERPDLFHDGATPETTTQGAVNNTQAYEDGTSPVTIGWRADGAAGEYMVGAIAHVAIFTTEVDLSTVFAAAATDGWI
jgi:hypothetical protein